ncbi:MAG TPA: Spy/CpxP family protein refolding chaperone [Blastocatellia bacterium]|nr:Spy/CpxP family protein refolding chaperone [Blastocatellia bacterium]
MKSYWNNLVAKRISASFCLQIAALCLLALPPSAALGQGIQRPARTQRQIQKKLDKQGANQIAPSSDSTSVSNSAQQDQTQPQKHSLDGVSKLGPRAMFKPDEVAMMIQGFGSPPAMMILMRQLDLTEEQKVKFRALRRQIGLKLTNLQNEKRTAETQLEDAIYGENFDPQKVETLAAQSAEKTAEIIKTQAFIESQFRQILTPDQFYVFRFLIGEMVLPQRRLTPQQLRQMQQRRLGGAPNGPNRPPNPELPEGDN